MIMPSVAYFKKSLWTYAFACIYIYGHMRLHVYTHIYTYIYTYTHTNIYIIVSIGGFGSKSA